MIQCTKEGSKLNFYNTSTEETAIYDLSDQACYNSKGKQVNNLNIFFRNYDFYDIQWLDTAYGEFVKSVMVSNRRLRNVGSMLNLLYKYRNNEGYILLGLPVRGLMSRPISDYSKQARKMLLELTKTESEYEVINWYGILASSSIEVVNVMSSLDTLKLSYSFTDLARGELSKIIGCSRDYNMNLKALLTQLDYYVQCEGYSLWYALSDLQDYNRMASRMSKKYQKYPKFLSSIHKIAIVNYNSFKRTYEEETFNRQVNKELAYESKDYSVITPTKTDDMREEGSTLHHCVASYIDRIIDGNTQVVFMRSTEKLDEPLITLEVKDKAVIQAKGLQNRAPSDIELLFIYKYAKKKGLQVSNSL